MVTFSLLIFKSIGRRLINYEKIYLFIQNTLFRLNAKTIGSSTLGNAYLTMKNFICLFKTPFSVLTLNLSENSLWATLT